jgi:ribosomal protein L11 methyltransferase
MHVWSKLSSAQWSDAWQERLGNLPHVSLVITEVVGRKTIRVEAFCEKEKDATAIAKVFGGSVRKVKMENWAAMAPEPSEPILIRDKLVVCDASTPKALKAFTLAHPGREIVAIPADLAFGTGHHATTATVLRKTADLALLWGKEGRKWSVCDLGCGTGILGIAARKLGADKVWGCDFDPLAVKVAKGNIERNGVDRVSFVKGDVLTWEPRQQWDLVLANIFYDVLTLSFEKIVAAMKPDGVVMVSGILKSYSADCIKAGSKAGIEWEDVLTKKGKWVTAIGRRKS